MEPDATFLGRNAFVYICVSGLKYCCSLRKGVETPRVWELLTFLLSIHSKQTLIVINFSLLQSQSHSRQHIRHNIRSTKMTPMLQLSFNPFLHRNIKYDEKNISSIIVLQSMPYHSIINHTSKFMLSQSVTRASPDSQHRAVNYLPDVKNKLTAQY